MQRQENGYVQVLDDPLDYGHKYAELSTAQGGMTTEQIELDSAKRNLVCGERQIMVAFPIIIRGRDASGKKFQEQSTVDRLGSRGVCTHLQRQLAPGAQCSVLIQLSMEHPSGSRGSWISAQVIVDSLIQHLPEGTWDTAMAFISHRFVYAR